MTFARMLQDQASSSTPNDKVCCVSSTYWLDSYFLFTPFLRIVPIFLSERVSRPSGFLMVPGGRLCFFSWLPTLWSLLPGARREHCVGLVGF